MDLLLMDIDIFSDDDNDDDELVQRRPYTIKIKPENFQVWDDVEFFDRFRLGKNTVLELLQKIEGQLLILWNRTRSLSPLNQLLLTLRFYATGNFLRACGDFSGVSISTASRIVAKVSMAIASLSPIMIKMPQSNEEIRKAQNGFYEMYKFPRVIGCIDGTHIRIQSPGGENAEEFRNRKGFFSLNTQVACDHNMKIINVVARWPGSVHDATIFQHSRLRRRFEGGEFHSGILLGDGGYPIKKFLLTPLSHPSTVTEERYNNAHIRTRNIIERVFGVWKRRFPVLSLGLRLKIETVQDIIVATAVLHNIARDQNEHEPADYVDLPDEEAGNDIENLIEIEGGDNSVRQTLIDEYFSRLRN